MAGELFDGELLVSLKFVPVGYWQEHASERESVLEIIGRALTDFRQHAELGRNLIELKERLS